MCALHDAYVCVHLKCGGKSLLSSKQTKDQSMALTHPVAVVANSRPPDPNPPTFCVVPIKIPKEGIPPNEVSALLSFSPS